MNDYNTNLSPDIFSETQQKIFSFLQKKSTSIGITPFYKKINLRQALLAQYGALAWGLIFLGKRINSGIDASPQAIRIALLAISKTGVGKDWYLTQQLKIFPYQKYYDIYQMKVENENAARASQKGKKKEQPLHLQPDSGILLTSSTLSIAAMMSTAERFDYYGLRFHDIELLDTIKMRQKEDAIGFSGIKNFINPGNEVAVQTAAGRPIPWKITEKIGFLGYFALQPLDINSDFETKRAMETFFSTLASGVLRRSIIAPPNPEHLTEQIEQLESDFLNHFVPKNYQQNLESLRKYLADKFAEIAQSEVTTYTISDDVASYLGQFEPTQEELQDISNLERIRIENFYRLVLDLGSILAIWEYPEQEILQLPYFQLAAEQLFYLEEFLSEFLNPTLETIAEKVVKLLIKDQIFTKESALSANKMGKKYSTYFKGLWYDGKAGTPTFSKFLNPHLSALIEEADNRGYQLCSEKTKNGYSKYYLTEKETKTIITKTEGSLSSAFNFSRSTQSLRKMPKAATFGFESIAIPWSQQYLDDLVRNYHYSMTQFIGGHRNEKNVQTSVPLNVLIYDVDSPNALSMRGLHNILKEQNISHYLCASSSHQKYGYDKYRIIIPLQKTIDLAIGKLKNIYSDFYMRVANSLFPDTVVLDSQTKSIANQFAPSKTDQFISYFYQGDYFDATEQWFKSSENQLTIQLPSISTKILIKSFDTFAFTESEQEECARSYISKMKSVADTGEGDNTTFQVISVLLGPDDHPTMKHFDLSADVAWKLFVQWNESAASQPGWDLETLRRKFFEPTCRRFNK